ncbi:hypothetical protein J1614_010919 [Plenodomus biglobosus]|nr:hypothetical protein J1614_010919 [Plenodomus biglobosus]
MHFVSAIEVDPFWARSGPCTMRGMDGHVHPSGRSVRGDFESRHETRSHSVQTVWYHSLHCMLYGCTFET